MGIKDEMIIRFRMQFEFFLPENTDVFKLPCETVARHKIRVTLHDVVARNFDTENHDNAHIGTRKTLSNKPVHTRTSLQSAVTSSVSLPLFRFVRRQLLHLAETLPERTLLRDKSKYTKQYERERSHRNVLNYGKHVKLRWINITRSRGRARRLNGHGCTKHVK